MKSPGHTHPVTSLMTAGWTVVREHRVYSQIIVYSLPYYFPHSHCKPTSARPVLGMSCTRGNSTDLRPGHAYLKRSSLCVFGLLEAQSCPFRLLQFRPIFGLRDEESFHLICRADKGRIGTKKRMKTPRGPLLNPKTTLSLGMAFWTGQFCNVNPFPNRFKVMKGIRARCLRSVVPFYISH